MDTIKAIPGAVWARVKEEPVMTLALVQAGLALAVGFGLHWTPEQLALTTAFAAAALGWVARSRVTPV